MRKKEISYKVTLGNTEFTVTARESDTAKETVKKTLERMMIQALSESRHSKGENQ